MGRGRGEEGRRPGRGPGAPAGAEERAGIRGGPPSVTERIEREELARGRRPTGEPPAEPRPAATVVLARRAGGAGDAPRPGAGGYEVLLLRRPAESAFAAGAFVFPGGTVDADDAAPALEPLLPPQPEQERPALAAGLRELFEETGFLLSDEAPPSDAVRRARRDLLAGRRSFLEVLRDLGASFRRLRATYLARWVTPEALLRRYDARFFLVEGEAGDPELTGELESYLWLRPAEAVERFRAGRLPMLFPTRATLETLAAHPTLEAVRAAWRGRTVEPVRPRLLVRGGSVRPVLPGEPGWEEAE